jgi:aspartate-semialdehyde dehydrogenase
MAERIVRAVVAGASSVLGKELTSELSASEKFVWDLKLLDADSGESKDVGGRISAVGDEALLIQPISEEAFSGIDLVFFAGDAEETKKYWKAAGHAGAAVVDLTGALAGEAGVSICAPSLQEAASDRRVMVSAHPAAIMLSAIVLPLHEKWPNATFSATVMEPASQQGNAGLDELHQQTAALLSFQPLPQTTYGGQAAFNLYTASPAEAKARLSDVLACVRTDLVAIMGDVAASALALQFVQAPVFHGYTASIFVDLEESVEAVTSALDRTMVHVLDAPGSCSNVSATEQSYIEVSVQRNEARGIWLWAACDNVKLAAQNAIACASALL